MSPRRTVREGSPPPLPAQVAHEERRVAHNELARARRYLEVLRTFYVAAVILLALPFALGLLVVLHGGEGVGFTIAVGVLLAVCLVGAIRMPRSPVFWARVIAGLGTVDLGLRAFRILGNRGLGISLMDLWTAFVVVGFWIGVGQAKKAAALARAHPDLWSARLMRGEIGARGGARVPAGRRA